VASETQYDRHDVRAPGHDGHDSGMMADSVLVAWRTLFRRDGEQFEPIVR